MRPGQNGTPIPDHRKAARGYLREGKPIGQALRDSGYSPRQARKGVMATLKFSAPLREAFKNEIDAWGQLAEVLPLQQMRANLIRVRLMMNVLRGKDAAVQSCKLLGQDREVNMWEPDIAVGVQVVMPPEMAAEYTVIEQASEEKLSDDGAKK